MLLCFQFVLVRVTSLIVLGFLDDERIHEITLTKHETYLADDNADEN